MLGLAGIGYFYLRLYDAARAPSVLLLRAGPALAD
jgi:lantibiotic modifying enzyme